MIDNPEFNKEQDKIDRGMMESQIKEQMAADVKAKIAQLIQGGVGRDVIGSKEALDYLVRIVGLEMTTVLCGITNSDLIAFRKTKVTKKAPRLPSALQKRNIAAAYMIVDILVSMMPPDLVREWLVSYDEYLFGIPAMELRVRPEDVRMAALQKLAGGS